MSEIEIWSLVLVVGTGFLATNLDNLILLVVLLGAESRQRPAVVLGYFCSAICVLLVAAAGVLLGAALDPAVMGYLGLAPLLMGAYLLFNLYRGSSANLAAGAESLRVGAGSGFTGAFMLLASNSGDSVAVFLPLLAESNRDAQLWIIGGFLLMVFIWMGTAWYIARQPQFARRIERAGAKLVPWILMAVGLYILLDTGSDTL